MSFFHINAHELNKLMKEGSKSVFPLSKRDLLILRKIAISDEPPNLLEITDYVRKDDIAKCDRATVSRRIFHKHFGTTLQNTEFIRRDHEKGSYIKEHRHYLILKGIFAVLTDEHFESIHTLKWYLHFLSSILSEQKLVNFSTNYIKSQILYFLFYHKISGLQLSNLKNPTYYYSEFFKKDTFRMFDSLPLSQRSKTEKKMFEKITCTYLTYDRVLEKIKNKQKFSNIEINESSLPLEYRKTFQDNKVMISKYLFVKKWYEFVSNVQIRYYKFQDYNKIPMKYKIEFIDNEATNLRDSIHDKAKRQSKKLLKSLI